MHSNSDLLLVNPLEAEVSLKMTDFFLLNVNDLCCKVANKISNNLDKSKTKRITPTWGSGKI